VGGAEAPLPRGFLLTIALSFGPPRDPQKS